MKTKIISMMKVPLFLLVVCVLAYGLLVPTLGFFWDDWPYAWAHHRFGPAGYPDFVASDRPYSAWIFMAMTWLLGEQPLGYHLMGIFLYWLCAVLFWQLVCLVWPAHQREAFWGALLFAVYPGFLGHPQAIIYNHHFTAMALYLFSLVGTVLALKNPKRRWVWHIPAVLAMVVSQFSIEYYLGWEAMRPILMWIALSPVITDQKKRLSQVLKLSVPYWLGTMGFLAWRLLVFQFPTYQPLGSDGNGVFSQTWLAGIFSQAVNAVFVAWGRILPQLSSQNYSTSFWLVYLGLNGLTVGLTFAYLRYWEKGLMSEQAPSKNRPAHFAASALVAALVGISTAGWPFWLVDLKLSIESPFFSRFTLAFVPWSSLLLVVLLHWLFKWRQQLTLVVVALIVGGSVGWHFWTANYYRNDWIEVQRYFQQLVTRVPGLTPGTTLVVNDMRSITLYQDDSLTSILNWTYDPENQTRTVNYILFYLSVRLGNSLPALEPGLPVEHPLRSMHFSGTTDQILVVHYDPPGCVRILDGRMPDRAPFTLPEKLVPAVPLSDISLILTEQDPPAVPPPNLFTSPVTPNWCLYFQEAELAAQRGDWVRVAELGDLAYAGDENPHELTENFVFIEGYLRADEVETAYALSKDLVERTDDFFDRRLCSIWRLVANDPQLNYEVEIPPFCVLD